MPFLSTGAFFGQVGPVTTVPAQFGSGDWSVADDGTSGDITITITALPSDGGSAITALEYQIDGGSWVSLGGTTTGDYPVSGLTDDVEVDVAIRAVNAVGNGTASATKAVTPTSVAITIVAAFTSISDLDYPSGTTDGSISETTTASHIAAYAKEGIVVASGLAYRYISTLSEGWIAGTIFVHPGFAGGTVVLLGLRGTSGSDLFRITSGRINNDSSFIQLQYWNGSSFANLGSSMSLGTNTLHRYDLQFKIADAGWVRLYMDGVLVHDFTGDTLTTAVTTIGLITLGPTGVDTTAGVCRHSGIIVADADTRSLIFAQDQASGDGGQTAWTGDYSSVTKTGRSDATYIESDTADEVETYDFPDLHTDLSSKIVEAVVMAGIGRVGNSGPGAAAAIVRSGSTDFEGGDLTLPIGQFGKGSAVMNVNPATAAAWTVSSVNGAEFGVKSKVS